MEAPAPFRFSPIPPILLRWTRRPGSRWYGGNPVLEESPGSRKTGRRLTAARRKPRESATESKPPLGFGHEVRVKGWGKSPPQAWQQGWQGKPRPEQDQVGGTYGSSDARAPGVSREAVSNGRPRGMAARPRKGRTEPGLQAFWSNFRLPAGLTLTWVANLRRIPDIGAGDPPQDGWIQNPATGA
jgi:hypothetical protein